MMADARFASPVTAFYNFWSPARLGPFAGQQNPTCGTAPSFVDICRTENIHDIKVLRRSVAFGTRVANVCLWFSSQRALVTPKFHYRTYDD